LRPVSRRSRLADGGRDVGDLVAARPRGLWTEPPSCSNALRKKGPHEVRLQPARLGLLHLLLDLEQPIRAHRLLGQRVAVEQALQVVVVEGVVDPRREPGADLRLVAVADGLDQQLLEALLLEDVAEDVEYPALQRLALDPKLFEQTVEDGALSGLLGDQAPEVADLGLVDPMDTAEPLLEPVGVPR
jgi:hypothetical protein